MMLVLHGYGISVETVRVGHLARARPMKQGGVGPRPHPELIGAAVEHWPREAPYLRAAGRSRGTDNIHGRHRHHLDVDARGAIDLGVEIKPIVILLVRHLLL